MNKIQTVAYELIREDARFLYTLVYIAQTDKNIKSNFICMSMPYIGLFADGSEQWGRKVGLNTPQFSSTEKAYYKQLRQGHKLFEKSYDDYMTLLLDKFAESEDHFYSIQEKISGYYNVGVDIYDKEFCGNTILCATYIPVKIFDNKEVGPWIRNMSVIVGKLASSFGCKEFPIYKRNNDIVVKPEDYHFFNNSPLRMNNHLGFLLFSILCSINYVIEFIENYFIEEIPQKFKFAYLQYYYLCSFIKELNARNNTNFHVDDRLCDRDFRNCLAHYGLGQYIEESEVIATDTLKGLTNKAFGKDYATVKKELYEILKGLAESIKMAIL